MLPSGNSTPLPVHLPSKFAGPPLGEKSIKISPSPFTTPDSDHSRVSSPFVQPGVPSAPRTVKVDPLPRISRAHLYKKTRRHYNLPIRELKLKIDLPWMLGIRVLAHENLG